MKGKGVLLVLAAAVVLATAGALRATASPLTQFCLFSELTWNGFWGSEPNLVCPDDQSCSTEDYCELTGRWVGPFHETWCGCDGGFDPAGTCQEVVVSDPGGGPQYWISCYTVNCNPACPPTAEEISGHWWCICPP